MSVLLKPLEKAINLALNLDAESKEKLAQFDQRTIAIDINNFQQTIQVRFEGSNIVLAADLQTTVDLRIAGSAIDLLKLGHDPEHLFSPDITIHGDIQFAKRLQDFLEGFDFDWEQQIARVTGDTLAYPIAQAIRHTGNWLQNASQSMQLNTAEYLREEINMLPDKSLINDYLSDIDALRADFDRLEARIKRLPS